jgi:CubicO group peptidase (beta-lactamase class C family)
MGAFQPPGVAGLSKALNRRGNVMNLLKAIAFFKAVVIASTVAAASVPALAEQLKPESNPGELGFVVDRLERVTQAFQGYVDNGQLPGAVVLIARKDKIAYFRAFGFRDREQKTPMTTDSIFRIASMTKPIVSVGAMMLAEEGKLDIGAPVSNYLPEFKELQVRVDQVDPATGKKEGVMRPQLRPMTVQDLLRHTAGLVYPPPLGNGPVPDAYRDANVLDRNSTLAEMVTKISKIPLAQQPGEVWEYSVAVDVLGRVIEVVSGMELDRFIEERITKPLGMTSTGFYVREADRDRLAQPQVDPATGKRPAMFDATQKPKLLSGGGGMVSTASDYLGFCQMLLQGGDPAKARLLSPSVINLMTSNALKPGIECASCHTAVWRYRTDAGNGTRLRTRFCNSYGAGRESTARVGRVILLDRNLRHDVLCRSKTAAGYYHDDPGAPSRECVLSARGSLPGIPGAFSHRLS